MGNERKCYYCPVIKNFNEMHYIDTISQYVCNECFEKYAKIIANPHLIHSPIFCKCGHLKTDHVEPEDVDVKDFAEDNPDVDEADLCLRGQCCKCDCVKYDEMDGNALRAEADNVISNEQCPRCGKKMDEYEDGPDSTKNDLNYTSYYCNDCELWIDGWIKKYADNKFGEPTTQDWRKFYYSE